MKLASKPPKCRHTKKSQTVFSYDTKSRSLPLHTKGVVGQTHTHTHTRITVCKHKEGAPIVSGKTIVRTGGRSGQVQAKPSIMRLRTHRLSLFNVRRVFRNSSTFTWREGGNWSVFFYILEKCGTRLFSVCRWTVGRWAELIGWRHASNS